MENLKKYIKEQDIINYIYIAQEDNINKKIMKINQEVKDEIKDINIEKVIESSSNIKELRKIFSVVEDNYNIKISRYNEEMYKQGFIDGVNLILNCLR